MHFLFKKIPKYLVNRTNVLRQILFTAVFALVFINIYAPFDAESWFEAGKAELLLYSSFYILSGILVIVISRLVLIYFGRTSRINYLIYIFWNVIELIIVALVYTFIEIYLLNSKINPIELYIKLLLVTLFVLVIPYSISWLWYSWKDQRKRIHDLSLQNLDDYYVRKLINFFDETNKLRFTLNSADVLYIESTDNYVTVFVEDKERIKKLMLRNTMKRLEKELEKTLISRCHRSYMVNYENVKMVRLSGTNLFVYIDSIEEIKIPVSRTFAESVHEMINRLSLE
ncbi:MAG: LytTR family transcriptional regulator [Bacteroidales bacterium]|nr:LytTR family transcriptional regulator [Bacteroidales bacterium]